MRLDREVIRALIDQRYGGSISRLAGALALNPPPDRSTVARWLASDGSHFPRNEERILALAGALDVDPTALWTFDTDNFPTVWPKIIRASRTGDWGGLLKALAFLQHFTEPADDWPAQSLARQYFDREWVVQEFAHDPRERANFYQSLLVTSARPPGAGPQVWHVASRHGGDPRGAKWQQLGFIKRDSQRVLLFNDWGITDTADVAAADSEICVRTWFGQGTASFRIASLHPFSMSLSSRQAPGMATVRFGVPGEPTPETEAFDGARG